MASILSTTLIVCTLALRALADYETPAQGQDGIKPHAWPLTDFGVTVAPAAAGKPPFRLGSGAFV